MKLTGITDEAGADIHAQIQAIRDLGWAAAELRNVAVADFPSGSIHEITPDAFDQVADALDAAGIGVSAIGSTIANWASPVEAPFDITLGQLHRVIPRAHRLGVRHIRIMSFAICKNPDGSDAAEQHRGERLRRLREIVARLGDAGLVAVHENCMNYGGLGISYTEDLLAEVPGLRLVFDSGNPVFNADRDRPAPHPRQDPWAFYLAVRDHVDHVHIKDCTWNEARQDADYTWPGEGHGRVPEIIADLKQRGYQGWISIEPHMAVVFHDPNAAASSPAAHAAQFDNFVAYGRRMAEIVARA
jgi:sugar phosphate isomerase/epimerase